jgi:ABC-type branched-subunit amino acid transport system substrate-binding protein
MPAEFISGLITTITIMAKMKRRAFLAAAGASCVTLAGCASDGGSGESTIEIGTMLPASGPQSGIGETMVDAADLAFGIVDNESDEFSVDATFGDTQSSPDDGISAASNLANAGIPAVVGAAITNIHIPVSEQVFVPNDMTACSPSATAVTISNIEDNGLLYRTTPSDALQGQVMARYSVDSLDAQTAATLHTNDDYGQALSNEFVNAFESEAGTVQREVSYETDAQSYTSRIERAVQDDPDLLAVVGYAESGVRLFQDYYAQYSADRDILTVDGLNTASVPNGVGRSMDNVVGTAPLVDGPGFETFSSLYQDEFDAQPGPFNPQTFDAAATLLLASAAADEATGPAISSEMEAIANDGEMEVTPDNLAEGVDAAGAGDDVQYQGASSTIAFDDNGDLQSGAYEVWKYAPDTESGVEQIDTFVLE